MLCTDTFHWHPSMRRRRPTGRSKDDADSDCCNDVMMRMMMTSDYYCSSCWHYSPAMRCWPWDDDAWIAVSVGWEDIAAGDGHADWQRSSSDGECERKWAKRIRLDDARMSYRAQRCCQSQMMMSHRRVLCRRASAFIRKMDIVRFGELSWRVTGGVMLTWNYF